MRKLVVVILVLTLALTAVAVFAGCSGDADIPGVKWTNKEELTYLITENNITVGKLYVVTEQVPTGEVTLNATGEKFNISSSASKGTRVSMRIERTVDGKEIMKSESIMDGFTAVASYKKKLNGDGTTTEIISNYDGKRVHYTVNGGEKQKTKIKNGYIDNGLLYTIVRCYSLEKQYNASFTVLDALTDNKEKIAVSAYAESTYTNTLNYVDGSGNANTATNLKCINLKFARETSPSGAPIIVTYTIEGDNGFYIRDAKTNQASSHFPVKIVENNLVYDLIEAKIS